MVTPSQQTPGPYNGHHFAFNRFLLSNRLFAMLTEDVDAANDSATTDYYFAS